MEKTEYLKKLNALNREFIKANRRLQDGEIVMRFQTRCVVIRATGVYAANCEVTYLLEELNKDDKPNGNKVTVYGYEWENVKTTGEFLIDDDIL